jgi:hypothetical protein
MLPACSLPQPLWVFQSGKAGQWSTRQDLCTATRRIQIDVPALKGLPTGNANERLKHLRRHRLPLRCENVRAVFVETRRCVQNIQHVFRALSLSR